MVLIDLYIGGCKTSGFEALGFVDEANEHFSMEIIEKIKQLAKGRFGDAAFEEFLSRFNQLSAGTKIIDSILQIITDEGDELEVGFSRQIQ